MDTNQPTTEPTVVPASSSPEMFTTKIPAVTAFAIAILLFLMPFADIKCNNTSLQKITGLELATGFEIKNGDSGSLMGNDSINKTVKQKDNREPNIFALAALGLGIIALVLLFTKSKTAIGAAMVTGIIAAIAMIGLMIDIKKKVKLDAGGKKNMNSDMDKFGQSMSDNLNITIDFTPWYYIAVIAFLAAAYFCYKRTQAPRI